MQLGDGSISWLTTSKEHCRASIENDEKMLELDGTQPLKVFGTKAGERQFLSRYRPGIDVTKVLGDGIQYTYIQLIGVLRGEI